MKRSSTPQHKKQRVGLNALILAALVVVLDIAMTLALEPYEAPTYLTWVNYRENAPDEIDNLVIGASTALEGIDPTTLDTQLNSTTFNQAFYGVSYKNAYRTLTTIGNERELKRVIVGVSYESLCSLPNIHSDAIFAQSKLYGESFPQQLQDCADMLLDPQYIGKPESFVFLAPWTVDNVGANPSEIAANISKRLTLTPKELVDTIPDFSDKGYVTHSLNTATDFNELAASLPLPTGTGAAFLQSNLDSLADMCSYAKSRGIEIYVVMMPRPDFNVLNLGSSYPEQATRLQTIVENAGGIYLDANALSSDIFNADQQDFVDEQHLNHSGAERFSRALAKLIRDHESGVDLSSSSLSYANWESYASTYDKIALVQLKSTVTKNTLSAEAIPTMGSNVQAEYRFVQVLPDGTEQELRGWSADTHFSTELQGHDEMVLRVYARRGSTETWDRYCTADVLY